VLQPERRTVATAVRALDRSDRLPRFESEIPDRSKQRTAGAHRDARDTASASNAATICSAAATGVEAAVSMWMSGSSGGS
jgi:hypothetical protein